MYSFYAWVCDFIFPLRRLGIRQYSTFFPLLLTTACAVLLEVYAYQIAHDPEIVGLFAIVVFIGLIIYFSFRDGLKGGFITSTLTISYYFYIIYTRNYAGQQLETSIETTLVLAVVYFLLAGIIGWLKQTVDVFIEREADERRRLARIIEQLPVGVIITDHKGHITQVNDRLGQIIGMDLPNDYDVTKLKAKPLGSAESPELSALHFLATVLSTGKAVPRKEFTLSKPGGKTVYLQANAAPVHTTSGRIMAAASIVSDITPQKEMEKRKDDFVNMASHELKSPITSMKLYIELLLNKVAPGTDPQTRKIITNIKLQVDRLQELVSDLLDVSRLQTGKLHYKKEMFNLQKMIEQTITELQLTTTKQSIEITRTVSVNVYADRFRLYQVLANLIANASKYSPTGSKIEVQVKRKDNQAVVSVKDYGIGIAKDQQTKIFKRLYQVADTTEKTFPGLGMGLFISKQIIKGHNGTIWVESKKDQGATFYFSLPLAEYV